MGRPKGSRDLAPRVRGDDRARIRARTAIDGDTGCWNWIGRPAKGGYHRVTVKKQSRVAHRWVYEVLVGPIPEGLTLDHTCQNPGCVNPEHLEPVTLAENIQRARARITHCPLGHAYDEQNTYNRPDGGRDCKACINRRSRERNERRRQAA